MSNATNVPKLRVEHLAKHFGQQQVLRDINFSVQEGETISLLGASGCGKTTILRILIGLLEPDAGIVYKDGIDITGLPPAKRGMGIVFQNYALFENMTVLGNVEYALKHNPQRKKDARKDALSLIERVGLTEQKDKRPMKLSGGQQQRVAIARTLAVNPDIILLDEPMSALDAETRLSLRGELKALAAEFGTTMLYITHDQEEAFAMSDRIIVMDGGDIQQMDTPERILSHPANAFVERFVCDNLRIKAEALHQFGLRSAQ